MVSFASSCLTAKKACDWAGPHVQVLDRLSSVQRGWVNSAKLGVNFPSWLTMPINLLSSGTNVGGLIFVMASVFSGSARIPLLSMIWPINLRVNSHFSGLSVALDASKNC